MFVFHGKNGSFQSAQPHPLQSNPSWDTTDYEVEPLTYVTNLHPYNLIATFTVRQSCSSSSALCSTMSVHYA